MTWRYIQTNGKTTLYSKNKDSLLFRHGSVTKKPSKTNNELSLLLKELAVLNAIAKLPMRLQTGALAELEDIEKTKDKGRLKSVNDQPDEIEESETELEERRKDETDGEPDPDVDPKEELKKRRMLEDFKNQFDEPDDAKMKALQQGYEDSKYSVLSYEVGSLNFEKERENGDDFMLELGCY